MNFEISSGKLQINGTEYSVPNIHLERVIGKGANGVVLLGKNPYLNRHVAVKIWMRSRQGDRRDKYEQGIREANKAASVEMKSVAKIYDAGDLGEYFYAVSEFIEGLTCKRWLSEHKPNLLSRLALASSITNDVFAMYIKHIIHGDLHSNNILILKPYVSDLTCGIFLPNFKIIDFGTSYFSQAGFSEKRHWNIFRSTIVELLYPFNIETLWSNKYPHGEPNIYIFGWYDSFFQEIPNMIRSFGIDLVADLNDFSKWKKGPSDEAPQYPDDNIRIALQQMRLKSELILTPETIGIIHVD